MSRHPKDHEIDNKQFIQARSLLRQVRETQELHKKRGVPTLHIEIVPPGRDKHPGIEERLESEN